MAAPFSAAFCCLCVLLTHGFLFHFLSLVFVLFVSQINLYRFEFIGTFKATWDTCITPNTNEIFLHYISNFIIKNLKYVKDGLSCSWVSHGVLKMPASSTSASAQYFLHSCRIKQGAVWKHTILQCSRCFSSVCCGGIATVQQEFILSKIVIF